MQLKNDLHAFPIIDAGKIKHHMDYNWSPENVNITSQTTNQDLAERPAQNIATSERSHCDRNATTSSITVHPKKCNS